jgi:hypothetical protein
MAITRLGLATPAANNDYAIASFTSPYLVSVTAANVSATDACKVIIYVVPSGASVASQYAYVCYSVNVAVGQSFETFRFATNSGDTLYVRSTTSTTCFSVNGVVQNDVALPENVSQTFTNKEIRGVYNTLYLDKGTTAQRLSSAEVGYVRYNTEFDSVETLTSTGWAAVGVNAYNTSAALQASISDETGSGSLVFATSPTLSYPVINNFVLGYTSTTTAAGTTTLTNTSNNQQIFTGTTTQTVVMPVASTMTTGTRYVIENNSTGNLTVNSSGGNLIATVLPGSSIKVTNILNSGTDASSWDYEYIGFNSLTGTGSVVLSTNPVITPAAATTATAASGAGYMGFPQNATTTGSATVVAADAGKHIYSTATRTVTIDSNANLPLPIGTKLTFIAGSGATVTIAITADTMYLAGSGATGSRTLAPFGMATAVKVTSTTWVISGNGLT